MTPIRTWTILLGLTAMTALLASRPGKAVTAALLLLAFLKARVILGGFLHLRAGWLTAFCLPLALWLAVIWGLHAL